MGGGGQGSGKVSYAPYLEGRHSSYLGGSDSFPISINITQAINAAISHNPFEDFVLDDPTAEITAMNVRVTDYDNFLDNINTDHIPLAVQSFGEDYDSQLNTKVIPEYHAALRDIGAVMSSMFVVGDALIYTERQKALEKFESGLRTRAFDVLADGKQKVMHYGIEVARLSILAENESVKDEIDFLTRYGEWDMNAILKGGQLIGAIAGGAVIPDKPSRVQSALGGALAGAAAGAPMGAPGIAGGALLGAAASFM